MMFPLGLLRSSIFTVSHYDQRLSGVIRRSFAHLKVLHRIILRISIILQCWNGGTGCWMTNTGQPGPLTLFAIEKISCKYQMRKNRLAGTSLFLKSLFSTTSNSVTLCFYWLAFVSVSIASYKSDQPALNSGAGLGIISTINMLFVIGFVGVSLK